MAIKKKQQEHALQNEIQNDLAGECMMFRANVGKGWTSNQKQHFSKPTHILANRGDVLLRNARPFSTGLPDGFTDLFGGTQVTITPEMVGKKILVFYVLEVKDGATVSAEQAAIISAVKNQGGIGGVARSVEDARKIVRKPKQKSKLAQEALIDDLINRDLIEDTRLKGG